MTRTRHSSSQSGYSRVDGAINGSRSTDINHSSLFNVGESADDIGRSRSWSRTSCSPSRNSGDRGISYFFLSFGDNKIGHTFLTSQFSAYNHGGLNIAHPRFPREAVTRGVYGETYIKIVRSIIIQTCKHILIRACYHIIITSFHLTFIQSFHHTNLFCVHIALLLLCMHLM